METNFRAMATSLEVNLSSSEKLGFTAQEVRDLRLVWNVFDVSNRNTLEYEDLRKALKLLGFKVTRSSVQQLAQDVQEPGSKMLTRNQVDFDGFLQAVSKLQGSSYDTHSEIVQAFEYIDKDGDGIITLDDLKAANDLARVGLSYEELTGLVEEADKDGDGIISKEDFISVMKRTNLFK